MSSAFAAEGISSDQKQNMVEPKLGRWPKLKSDPGLKNHAVSGGDAFWIGVFWRSAINSFARCVLGGTPIVKISSFRECDPF